MQRQKAVREEEKRMPDKLDQFDRSILEVVQRDCQLKAEAIADKVGMEGQTDSDWRIRPSLFNAASLRLTLP